MGFFRRLRNRAVLDCTTQRRNAHGTGIERELLYPWHPWAGRQIYIHELIEKSEETVFRCSLSGRASDRWQEVPAWMFDRALSTDWQITSVPCVDNAALGVLASLLRDAAYAPSHFSEMGAALRSHDANRGEFHAAQQAHDTSVRRLWPGVFRAFFFRLSYAAIWEDAFAIEHAICGRSRHVPRRSDGPNQLATPRSSSRHPRAQLFERHRCIGAGHSGQRQISASPR